MPMRQEFTNYEAETGQWAGDYSGRETILPGGVHLTAAAFPLIDGVARIPSGTLIGRTIAERDAGTGFGPYAAGDAEVFLTYNEVYDVTKNNQVAVYRHGFVVYEDYLPASSKVAANLAAIRERYTVMRGRS